MKDELKQAFWEGFYGSFRLAWMIITAIPRAIDEWLKEETPPTRGARKSNDASTSSASRSVP